MLFCDSVTPGCDVWNSRTSALSLRDGWPRYLFTTIQNHESGDFNSKAGNFSRSLSPANRELFSDQRSVKKCSGSPDTNCPRLITRPMPAERAASSLPVCTCGPKAIERLRISGDATAANACGSPKAADKSRQTILPVAPAASMACSIVLTERNANPRDWAAPPTVLMSIRSVEHRTTQARGFDSWSDIHGR